MTRARHAPVLALTMCMYSAVAPREALAQSVSHANATRAAPLPSSSPTPAPDARERARPHFERGLALVAQQSWSDALDAFLAARAIYPSPILEFDVGYCQRALGQYVAALARFRVFLSSDLSGAAESRRAEAEGYVSELLSRVATVTLRVPDALRDRGELMIDGHPVQLGQAPSLSVPLDPGHHTVHFRHDGYRPLFIDRDLAPGSSVRVDLQPTRVPARLVVQCNAGSAIARLDDRPLGRTPLDVETAPGPHQLVLVARGYVTQRSRVALTAGSTLRLNVELSREPPVLTRQWWFWTAIGAVATGIGATTYLATRPPPPYDGGNLGVVFGSR